ncbi:glycoside hydrolase family 16 protein [Flavobacterium sp. DG2-3]|uniref:glycoside hydrolase family 16 protein n=1 Tax=Flavobacterium sp. DG2-3 TaxID=3068317 RepID=UPI00273D6577|nr:glycoside hydrolase family 16 protein [Flavobacterium sp. DG2-3]MDP5199353.1 glycoside hydrolase family 16 protein [Flavobacterium sp. DG2-3]
MKIINLINRAGVFTLILLFVFQSCSSNNDSTEDPVVVAPDKISLQVDVVGKTAEMPNGDGSGKISLKIEAANAKSYKIVVNNETKEITANTFAYEFTEPGTKSYTIDVTAFNGIKYTHTTATVNIFVARKLIWSDEFNTDGAPDSSKWGYDLGTGNGFGNNELQYYTNRTENVRIDNGTLKITAIREDYQGSKYTSTRMLTKGKFSFKYGRAEVRAKLPVGGGTWPAFWLLGDNIDTVPWPACGEIDILESVGNNPDVIHSSLHSPGRSGNTPDTKTIKIANTATEFHIYAAEWSAESIKFYVDDTLFYTFKNSSSTPFNEKFFVILNFAMGGNFGGAVDPNFKSATYEVDYVRVYN